MFIELVNTNFSLKVVFLFHCLNCLIYNLSNKSYNSYNFYIIQASNDKNIDTIQSQIQLGFNL